MTAFDEILKLYKTKTCVLSIEKFDDSRYGNIRVVAGNQAHCDDILHITGHPFVPGCPYEMCFPKDMNFEDFCYRAAVGGEPMHTYINLYQMGLWLNMFMIPLESDEDNKYYCIYSYEVSPQADSESMSDVSADAASKVLQTVIKLRGTTDFDKTINEIVSDIRGICDSDECCIVHIDHDAKKCHMLGRSGSDNIERAEEDFPEDVFYNIACNWDNTLRGSTCIIIKDENDMDIIRQRDPAWYDSLMKAKIRSMVFFPLMTGLQTIGYMWALNFNTDNAVKIKEILELTSFFLAAEISNHILMDRLKTLSSIDLLTGIMNRNIMNNRVDRIIAGKDVLEEPYAIIFSDLNGLKRFNDTQGHQAGDDMLKEAAKILSDVFYDSEVYRVGGDEFMVIATKMDAETVESRVADLIARSNATDSVRFAVGVSLSKDEPDILKAMRIADKKMYEDKKHYYEEHPDRIYRQ